MDAIPQDVDEELKEDEALEEKLSRHQSEIERIAASVQEGHENYDGDPEQEEEVQDFSSPLQKKDDEWYVTAKVDGEEKEVLWQDVLKEYQKNSSGDKRLQEAAERQRELADYEAKLNAYRKHLEAQTHQPSSDADVSPSNSDATDALYEQYHDALFQGDETKANKLLKDIRGSERPQQQVDVKTIVEQTKAQMREEEKEARERGYERRRQEAVDMFHKEYPEVASDTSLLAVADRRSAELYQENPTRDPWDIMQECGVYAREWLLHYVDELGGKADKGTRKKRKQDMDEVAPRNVRGHIGEDEAMPTYSNIISEMRKERGQPS
mgnify:CR=1 FL=1